MDLLILNDNVVIPNAYTLTVEAFKTLVERDKTASQYKSTKELAYVYFMCDHRSPFSVYEENDRPKEVKLNVFGADSKWEADEIVKAACAKYIQLTETPAVCLLKAARESVTKMQKYFRDIDLTALDDRGKPIYNAKDLVTNLSKMGDVVAGLAKLEDLVKREEAKNNPNRGGVVVNKYSS